MTEQTGDVLADIDAALEGWHGRDASIGPDAMRWAPERPEGVRVQMDDPSAWTAEQIARIFDVPVALIEGPVRARDALAKIEARRHRRARAVDFLLAALALLIVTQLVRVAVYAWHAFG